MNVLIIRHAEAAEHEEDEKRPLTDAGRKTAKRVGKALDQIFGEVDLLASSPLVRAVETARIIANRLDLPDVEQIDELSPGAGASGVLRWLAGQGGPKTVAIVGHEPDLSRLVGLSISGREASVVKLRKGAACLVEFTRKPAAGEGVLHWLMMAEQLELIALGESA